MLKIESMEGDLQVGGSFFFESKWVAIAAKGIPTKTVPSKTNAAAATGGPDSGI